MKHPSKGGIPVNAELKNAIKATDSKAEYDTSAEALVRTKEYIGTYTG